MTAGRRAWGFEFRFVSDDEALLAHFDWCFGDMPRVAVAEHVVSGMCHGRAESEDDVVRYDVSLVRSGEPIEDCGQGWPQREVMSLLAAVVNGQARRSASDGTVLHAAVFGGPSGVVVLCGDTGAGKSTISAAAARRGWWHLSDDLALVDVSHGAVTPYPRPLMLRAGSQDVLGGMPEWSAASPAGHERFTAVDRFVPASALGAVIPSGPQPLVALGFLQRGPQAAVQPLRRAQTLHALTVHSANLPDRGAAEFDELVRLAEAVEGFTVTVADPDETLDLLAPLVGQPVA